MTADPLPSSDRPVPGWPVPPPDGYFAEDLDRMHDLPSHTELIDGSLVFVSPQAKFHMLVIDFLNQELNAQAPEELEVSREMTITIGPRQRPEPDILVARAAGDAGLEQTTYLPEDIVLVIEVVSPDSLERDRKRKPLLYAEAGIPYLWRVEKADDRAVFYTYEFDPGSRAYSLTGIHHDRLQLELPFPIDLDLRQATRRRRAKE
ncbi:Uma2 family endonuclease [Nocardia sp. NPDC058058]|uniref:Uma2 family endonuclease n=1 Tax=Nocardia sp. NPDC058058 TaxID=3346317 RepID=UPI0036DDF09A